MLIKMNHTSRGTEDGFVIRQYLSGFEYDVAPHLAVYFVGKGVAEMVGKEKSNFWRLRH